MTDQLIKRIVFNKFGGYEELKVVQVKMPEPGKNEVRIKVNVIGINRAEELYRAGTYYDAPKSFPASLGYEASGIIDKIGEGVKDFSVGDSVSLLVNFSQAEYSAYGEYIVFPVDSVIKNPDNITHREAASIWMSYLTAYFALNYYYKIKKGDVIVITAASSSASLGAIQLSKILGATVIATSRTSSKKSDILALGADYFIATQEEDLEKRILEITNQKGANVVYDPVGGPTLKKLINATAKYGMIIEYGVLSPEPTIFPTIQLMEKFIEMKAYNLTQYSPQKDLLKIATDFIIDHIKKQSFKSIVGKEFHSIESIPESHKYLSEKNLFGKVIVTLDQ